MSSRSYGEGVPNLSYVRRFSHMLHNRYVQNGIAYQYSRQDDPQVCFLERRSLVAAVWSLMMKRNPDQNSTGYPPGLVIVVPILANPANIPSLSQANKGNYKDHETEKDP